MIIVTYGINKELYHSQSTRKDTTLITTEYTHKNNMLVSIQLGKNATIRSNNLLQGRMKSGRVLESEQFFSRKTYDESKAKPITRSSFEEKLKGFSSDQTTVRIEIVENYAYKDTQGNPNEVQIVIVDRGVSCYANIDFKTAEEHQNFIPPLWLTKYEE